MVKYRQLDLRSSKKYDTERKYRLFGHNRGFRLDLSLKSHAQSGHISFSPALRFDFMNELIPINILSGKPPLYIGPVITPQFVFGHQTLFTPKMGYRVYYDIASIQTDIGMNTDFENISYSFTLNVGLSIWELIGIYYEYDYQWGRTHFPDIGRHRFGVFITTALIPELFRKMSK